MKIPHVLSLLVALALPLPAQAGDSPERASFPAFDAHLHVDVPLAGDGTPFPAADLKAAMAKAGMDGIAMTFAVDYVTLKEPGQAWRRFLAGLDGQAELLRRAGLALTPDGAAADRALAAGKPVVIQAVEGAHWLEGDVSRIAEAYGRGLRVFCLLHDNDADPALGDVYTNEPKFGGLTPLGADAIRECERLGILVDLAHADDKTIRDALAVATRPLVVSHTGPATRPGRDPFMAKMMAPRLIREETARAVAAAGGLVGVWPHLCATPADYAANVREVAGWVGTDHVCIGTDSKITPEIHEFDPEMLERIKKEMAGRGIAPGDGGEGGKRRGPPPQDLSRPNHVWPDEPEGFFPTVVRALRAEGFSDEDIAKVVGGNFLRLFREVTVPAPSPCPDHP